MVTAETAVVLPVLLLVLGLCVWVVATVSAQLRCTDAAALAARAAARGEDAATVAETARRAAPRGASVEVQTGAEQVVVVVRVGSGSSAGVLSALPAVEVTGRAVAAREDAVGR